MHEHLKLTVNGKPVKDAHAYLTGKGKPPSAMTVDAIKAAGKELLLDQFNDDTNLWSGPAGPNQEKGRQFAVAKTKVDQAIATGDKALFDANIAILENLWHDPDPSGQKSGFTGMVGATIQMLRSKFKPK